MRRPLPFALLLFAACSDTPTPRSAGTGALLPDTQTVAGVLEMRHPADAFERAPQWRLDTVPIVMFDGGEEVDLTYSVRPIPLSDGRVVVDAGDAGHRGHYRLFEADGRPGRILVRSGEGPEEMAGRASMVLIPGDTLVVFDAFVGNVKRFTVDGGFVSGVPANQVPMPCFQPLWRLADGRHAGVDGCSQHRRRPDGTYSPTVALVVVAADFASYDSIAAVPGERRRVIEMREGGRTHPGVVSDMHLGQRTSIGVVDSTIVVGSGDGGYVLDLRNTRGVTTGRIVVERPVLLMNDRIRKQVIEESIAQALANAGPGYPRERAVEVAEQEQVTDTVAAYGSVSTTAQGTIWVRDTRMPGDSTWSVTAFGRDGAILGRLSGSVSRGRLSWLGDDRAIVRHEDEDGVVRYGVYGIVGR